MEVKGPLRYSCPHPCLTSAQGYNILCACD